MMYSAEWYIQLMIT